MSHTQPRPSADERRHNPELRALIDEMLDRVRELHRRSSLWNSEERAQAEAALEQIMSRVRREAASSGSRSGNGEPGGEEQ